MSSRITRGAVAKAAKAATVINEAINEKKNVPRQSSSLPAITTGANQKKGPPRKPNEATAKQSSANVPLRPATNIKKRKRTTAPKIEEDPDELPHNLGKAFATKEENFEDRKDEDNGEPPSKKKVTRKIAGKAGDIQKLAAKVQSATSELQEDSPAKKSRKRRTNAYGLTPGVSPFPDWPHPTVAECQEVVDLLSKIHGPQIAPATIPTPSLTVSGCGEVPSILDAMIRTLLSAATTGTNSSRAFKGLVDRFGILKEGIGKGSVDWDAVRRAEQSDIFEAIKIGGLAANKSKNIKAILEKVHEENLARRDALVRAKEENDATIAPKGAENESSAQQLVEVVRADQHVLSLDHLHALPTHDAMEAMMQYPGIGVKTSSCVALFCMRRPSLAVDTHVFRLLKWLNWVPPSVKGEIAAFSHVEVRVPDDLKYALHQLFIKHGKTCPRCRAATGETSEDWDKGCAIDHLVTRTGKRKGAAVPAVIKKKKAGGGSPARPKKRNAKGKKIKEEDESDPSSDLTDLDIETETEKTEETEEEDDVVDKKVSQAGRAKNTKADTALANKATTKPRKGKNAAEKQEDLTDPTTPDTDPKNGQNGTAHRPTRGKGNTIPPKKRAVISAEEGNKILEIKADNAAAASHTNEKDDSDDLTSLDPESETED